MLEDHPLAQLFPTMNEKDFEELKSDIAEAGEVFIPIELYEGKILDGRHRYRACTESGLECPTREYTGTEPLKRIMSLNERRRHLSVSDRALIAAKIANMPRGKSVNLPIYVSQSEAAEQLGVSTKSVGDAKVVLDSGDEQLIADVENGKSSVSQAAGDVRKQRFINQWATPDEQESLRLEARSLEDIYSACKERQQLDIWLRTQRGETQRSIASELSISQGMVSKILQEARDVYGHTEDTEDEDPGVGHDTPTYIPGLPYPVTADEAEEIILDQADENLEQENQESTLIETSLSLVDSQPEPSPLYQEFIYQEISLDGYKRWLDVFAKHIALIGGLEDVGGMTTILTPLSLEKRETILQEMLRMRDHWNKHIDDAMSMMSRDLISVGRTVVNGQ